MGDGIGKVFHEVVNKLKELFDKGDSFPPTPVWLIVHPLNLDQISCTLVGGLRVSRRAEVDFVLRWMGCGGQIGSQGASEPEMTP